MSQQHSGYTIPPTSDEHAPKPWLFLIPPLFGISALAVYREQLRGLPFDDYWGVFILAFLAGIPVAGVIGIVRGIRWNLHVRRTWSKHDFNWYRQAFPEHALEKGGVSCRHCGSDKTRVTNLMKRSYMRLHSCKQCGQTLYFSKEHV